MDTLVKRGEVYLQHQKNSEKWKRYWLNLYPDSRNGVARLELKETNSDRSPVVVRRQPDRKVIRLSECISVVRLPPHAEAHPEDNMAAFCVETADKKLVFAVQKEGCEEWVEKICDTAFQKGSSNVTKPCPQMEENQIYASREEVFEFWVTVQQSEASARCGLRGAYFLQTSEDTLILKDCESRQSVMEWPYKLLRRYGRDKTMFSIEAGRRCDSGSGTFNFETKQSDTIHNMVERAIRQQKSLSVSGDSCLPQTPLPRTPISASLLDTQTNSGYEFSMICDSALLNPAGALSSSQIGSAESACVRPATANRYSGQSTGLPEPVYSTPVHFIGSYECEYAQPTDAIRSQQTVKNDRPIHHHSNYLEPVYADPVDVIRPNPNTQASVCSNPVDKVTPFTSSEPSHLCNPPEPVYSEVLNVPPDSAQKQVHNQEEPIYSLPIFNTVHKTTEDVCTGFSNESKQGSENKKKAETTIIYSQVNKTGKTTRPIDKTAAHKVQDIISENLGLI